MGKLAGTFELLGRAELKPGGGDNGLGAEGIGAVEGHDALLWDTRLTGAGDGAGEALCTSSLLWWLVMVGCTGKFKQLVPITCGGAKLEAQGMVMKGVVNAPCR